jgi:3-methyl-2-oxobutanoate hydroxymethyltransferase
MAMKITAGGFLGKKDLTYLLNKKKQSIPITMVTAYDCPTARIEDAAGIDAVLVGDSLGTNVLGYGSERQVTMADMIHHTAAVARGIRQAYILADLPFRSVETNSEAEKNAALLVKNGAECVKIEGWREKCPVIEHLSKRQFRVCAHIGYNPQIHGPRPRTFGKTAAEAHELLESGRMLQDSGAQLIVVEKITTEVAGMITGKLCIPVIGIGSGPLCDGQVLVINDLLGFSQMNFRHVRRFAESYQTALQAVTDFIEEVEKKRFPAHAHSLDMDPAELTTFQEKTGEF